MRLGRCLLCVRFSVVDLLGAATTVATLTGPAFADGTGGGLYTTTADVTAFPNGDGYQFVVTATVAGKVCVYVSVMVAGWVVRLVGQGLAWTE